jgi:hypothetical protein
MTAQQETRRARKIIGLTGAKGAGKDTAAAALVEQLGFRRIAFADALYLEVADAFGVTVPHLANRDTKETPLPELAIDRCADRLFIEALRATAVDCGVPLDMDCPRSPRWILQRWGTEYRRQYCHDDAYWLDQVQRVIDTNPARDFVVTDVRYLNEAQFIRRAGEHRCSRLVRVRRALLATLGACDQPANDTAAHRSETELLAYPADLEIVNEEGCAPVMIEALLDWVGGLP